MSSYVSSSAMLPAGYLSKNNLPNKSLSKSINSQSFAQWSMNNIYKSTYANYHSHQSTSPKSSAIPGYQGFIPSYRSESLYGKGYTSLTKQVFMKENFGKNRTGLSSNGFNVTDQAKIDHSKPSMSSKYGKSTLVKAHPNWNSSQWKTTIQQAYQDPKGYLDLSLSQSLTFSKQFITKNINESNININRNKNELNNKLPSINSGYSINRTNGDGKGWSPVKELKGLNVSTEYRNIYNPEQQFHRNLNISKSRKLKKVSLNYKFNY